MNQAESLAPKNIINMAKKKAKKGNAQMMSPEKYIKTKARTLPLGKTYISRKTSD